MNDQTRALGVAPQQPADLCDAVIALNTGWNNKEPEHLIAERIDLCRRLALAAAQPPSPPAPSAQDALSDAQILANADRLFPRWREDIQERFVLENARAALALIAPPQPPVPEPSADAVWEALAELVALKALKDKIERGVCVVDRYPDGLILRTHKEHAAAMAEYDRRKPLAWAAASVALAASPKDQP